MAHQRSFPLDVKAASGGSAGDGNKQDVSTFNPFTFFLYGTFVATVQLQISFDGVEWFDEQAALTAKGKVVVTAPCMFARAKTTSFTSGAPTGEIVGVATTHN